MTATRREENQQDVPTAVTTLDTETLRSSQFVDNVNLATVVPGLDVRNVGVPVSNIFVRGVGSNDFNLNASQAVGTVVDDLFIQNAVSSNVLLYDVQSVEVAKGRRARCSARTRRAGR